MSEAVPPSAILSPAMTMPSVTMTMPSVVVQQPPQQMQQMATLQQQQSLQPQPQQQIQQIQQQMATIPQQPQQQEVRCNLWTRQTLDRLRVIFPDSRINVDQMFIGLLKQAAMAPHTHDADSGSDFIMQIALWLLVRIYNTESPAIRHKYLIFLQHLENVENEVRRSLELNRKFPPVPARPHPPEQVLFPISK